MQLPVVHLQVLYLSLKEVHIDAPSSGGSTSCNTSQSPSKLFWKSGMIRYRYRSYWSIKKLRWKSSIVIPMVSRIISWKLKPPQKWKSRSPIKWIRIHITDPDPAFPKVGSDQKKLTWFATLLFTLKRKKVICLLLRMHKDWKRKFWQTFFQTPSLKGQ